MQDRPILTRFARAGFVLLSALALLIPSASWATSIPLDSVSGIDNSGGLVTENFVVANAIDWLETGIAGSGSSPGSLALTVSEFAPQCLRENGTGSCILPSDTAGRAALFASGNSYTSDVSLEFENTSGAVAPILFWFTGLAPAGPPYTPGDVSFDDTSASFDVMKYTVGAQDYFYLGFLFSEFSDSNVTTVQRTFRYQVGAGMLAGGTPIFSSNGALNFTPVPEPSGTLLIGLGLIALVAKRSR